MNITIIGSGFAGSVFARLAADEGHHCTIYESRPHLGGNAFDHKMAGITVHAYGPHYFRTNSMDVVQFLSRFTEWQKTTYRVLAKVGDRFVRFPLNIGTYEDLYGKKLSVEEWKAELASRRIPVQNVANAEEKLISEVGEEFYKLFYEGYTAKQWGRHPSQLLPYVVARIPVYYEDKWQYVVADFQAMPKDGYTKMFERMLSHPLIDVKLSTPWNGDRGDLTVYTGPLDAWFGHKEGKLPYRSLEFKTEVLDCKQFQPCGQVNYPDVKIPFTRTVEWKHVTGETNSKTVVTWEYPKAEGQPFYPMPTENARLMADAYKRLAAQEEDVVFIGRLATYQYLNMDQVVLQAMQSARNVLPKSIPPVPAFAAWTPSPIVRPPSIATPSFL